MKLLITICLTLLSYLLAASTVTSGIATFSTENVVSLEEATEKKVQMDNVDNNDTLTPMEFYYKKSLKKDDITLYHRYAQHFLDTKTDGSPNIIQNILMKNDGFLKYYEGLVKGMYHYYFTADKTEYDGLKVLLMIYDKTFNELKDSFEGLLVQDIFLKEGFKDKLNIVTSPGFCDVLPLPTDKKACQIHMATRALLLNDKNSYIMFLSDIKNSDEFGEYEKIANFVKK